MTQCEIIKQKQWPDLELIKNEQQILQTSNQQHLHSHKVIISFLLQIYI